MIDIWVFMEDFSLDERMDVIAKSYGGNNTGSGFGFGRRDRSYKFNDSKSARRFIAHAKKFKKVYEVKIY